MPDDTGYLAFFTRIVERLEGGMEKVGKLVEEESATSLHRSRRASSVISFVPISTLTLRP
jgi:hypothetical protein